MHAPLGFGGGWCETNTLLSTTYYYYNENGNVERVVTQDEGSDWKTGVRMVYAKNHRTVTYTHNERWTGTGTSSEYFVDWAHEYRYDGARQRYLDRKLDPADLLLTPPQYTSLGGTWTDYDGDTAYGDFTVVSGTMTEETSYQPGLARVEDLSGTPATKYYHGDMIGSTRLMTNASGSAIESTTYTAFGERMSGTNHRYGYAGAWGYQQDAEMPFMHVGARYYDPGTGRFLQRDPIGIEGGLNVYGYVRNASTRWVDPDGMYPYGGFPNMPGKPRPPKPPKISYTYEEMERERDFYSNVAIVAGVCIGIIGLAAPFVLPAVTGGVSTGAAASATAGGAGIVGTAAAWK